MYKEKNEKNRIFLKIITFIVLIIFLLTLSITITINFRPLFKSTISSLSDEQKQSLSDDAVYKNYKQLMSYLNSPFKNKLEMDDFHSSSDGEFHFYEVKKLFMLNYALLALSIIYLIIIYIFYFKTKKLSIAAFRIPMLVVALLPLTMVVFVFADFSTVFLKFHELLFNNDKWMFNPLTDPIINILTQSFFNSCFIMALTIFEALIIGISIHGFVKHRKNNSKK